MNRNDFFIIIVRWGDGGGLWLSPTETGNRCGFMMRYDGKKTTVGIIHCKHYIANSQHSVGCVRKIEVNNEVSTMKKNHREGPPAWSN